MRRGTALSYFCEKDVNYLEKMSFESIYDFVDAVNDMLEVAHKTDKYADVSIIAKYDEATKIIAALISAYDYHIHSIELIYDEFGGYEDEYIISLESTYGKNELFCDPFKRGDNYIYDKSTISFVIDNCCSRCLENIHSNKIVEVSIEDEDGTDLDDYNSESTYVSRDDDGVVDGFTKSWHSTADGVDCYSSYSYFSNNADDIKEIAEKFGVKL